MKTSDAAEKCRCGWDGSGDHPCHYRNYTCKAAATARFYEPTLHYSIAGQQDKRSVVETFACDACWADFLETRRRAERGATA